MRRALVLLGAAVLTSAIWLVASEVGTEGPTVERTERPQRLFDEPVDAVERITVEAAGGGRTATLRVQPDGLRVVDGQPVDAELLDRLHDALFPLLAIRVFDAAADGFGLSDPRLSVTFETLDSTTELQIGSANFDETSVYVQVDGQPALVLPVVAEALGATVGMEP